jgi:hypothetical protein
LLPASLFSWAHCRTRPLHGPPILAAIRRAGCRARGHDRPQGNKKVSVTLYGKVNKAVLFWDDGAEKNIYAVDNNYES